MVDADAARTALQAGTLTCPQAGCEGRLRPWGHARPRSVLARVGQRCTLTPDRARCKACRAGQTLLPAWYVPSRSCGIEVIGAALTGHLIDGHGQAQVAAGLGLAVSTVRGWLHGARQGAATALHQLARDLTRNIDAQPASAPLFSLFDPTPEAVQQLADLARTALAWLHPDPPNRCYGLIGIDYVRLLILRSRRDSNRWLRLVDPTDARPWLDLWPAINILTGGRLPGLFTVPAPG